MVMLKEAISKRFYEIKENLRFKILFRKKADALSRLPRNKRIIILSNDCTGGRIMHDYKLPSYTPTVNTFLNAEDFLVFCENLEYYTSLDIKESHAINDGFPLGDVGGLLVHFHHDHSFDEARKKWIRGCKSLLKAINGDYEICVVMNDRNGFLPEMLNRFDSLPYKYKVIFTHNRTGSPNSFYMKGEDDLPFVSIITDFESKLSLHRKYDRYDFYKWFREIYE